jgi:thiamine monophosphate kinase
MDTSDGLVATSTRLPGSVALRITWPAEDLLSRGKGGAGAPGLPAFAFLAGTREFELAFTVPE